jgi:c-di-GMP-related signal transduction protein
MLQGIHSMNDFKATAPSLVGTCMMGFATPLPDVPAMTGTRLQLELLLQEATIDLSAVSAAILADAGATLQILRLIGEEFPEEEGRPTRMEDCLVSLTMERIYQAVCASRIPQDSRVMTEWQRCRRVAESARELARCVDGFCPDEAYMVGLLHAVGVMLAESWRLPEFVVEAIRERRDGVGAQWSGMLAMAERMAARGEWQ